MKGFVKLMAVVVTAAAFVVSCGKDKDSGTITLDIPAAYISQPGGTATVSFSVRNISTLSASSKPTGWDEPEIDFVNGKITVTAPSAADIESEEAVKSGVFTLIGRTPGGSSFSTTLFAGVITTTDMSGKVANSYIVSEKETNYQFDATRKGDGSQLATDHIGVIWQSKSNLLQYTHLNQGKAAFYVGADADDDTKIKTGNALIGAYNADDELIWSWHIWITDFDPEADALIYSNGYTVMRCNLGAFNNANSTTDEILASYGLYYQWGRKDPFIGPSTYRGSEGTGAAMYNGSGTRIYVTMIDSDQKTGTVEYALQNPLSFINGIEDSEYDWLWSDHSAALWSESAKTVNDPCPYGWRVAPADAFAGLTIADDLNAGYEPYYDKYGWTLTDGTVSSLYIGGGRRRYDNGKIFNIYNPLSRSEAMDAQPWEGLYWTSRGRAASGEAAAFYFWFCKKDVPTSGILLPAPYYRSNGMQVRCVKMQ
ncbi:hypothetical protein [uncultured Alistipes sp.]|uniref:hypothetical protein n=1 Tax=uncultured Alistipes sp. TaxID=538949 RepID=UPI0025F625E4|nr:hypothetical protein [uncultured Alistipes sp.]